MKLGGFGRFGLALAFVVQAGLLGWLLVDRAMLLKNGREIRLPVIPVDPRDLLRGDYVVLSYPISRIEARNVEGDDDFNYGDTAYVTIVPEGEGWKATAINRERPDGDGTVLRGTVASIGTASDCPAGTPCQTYVVNYNLERYFVPEGEGRDLETLRNDQKLSVDVALSPSGRAALKRLLVDGDVRYEESIF